MAQKGTIRNDTGPYGKEQVRASYIKRMVLFHTVLGQTDLLTRAFSRGAWIPKNTTSNGVIDDVFECYFSRILVTS